MGPDVFRSIAGEDSLQALTLGLDFLRDDVRRRARKFGLDVAWRSSREDVIFCHLDRAHEQTQVAYNLLVKLREAMELVSAPDSNDRRDKLSQMRALVEQLSPHDGDP